MNPPKLSLPQRLSSVTDLIEIVGRLSPSTAVLPGGHRVEDLRLVESARDHGFVDRIILVGQKDRIAAAVAEAGIAVAADDMVAADDDQQIAAATVELIKAGGIDIVLEGDMAPGVLLRHMRPLAVRPTVSLATVFDAAPMANGRPMLLTDAGVTRACNFGRMVDMVRNAIDVAQSVMGIERPRVAILSASEKQDASLPSTRIGLQLARRCWPDAVVCGPLSLDLAVDPASVPLGATLDLPGASEVVGQADILVCPGLDVASVLYKAIAAMSKYGEASLANIMVGFPVPCASLSPADTLETRLASIALCAVYARRRPQDQGLLPQSASGSSRDVYRILAVSTAPASMRVAVYENDCCQSDCEVVCEMPADSGPAQCRDRVERMALSALDVLDRSGNREIHAVAARGRCETLEAGAYLVAQRRDAQIVVDEALLAATLGTPEREPASDAGPAVAAALARKLEAPAVVVVDPIAVDESVGAAGDAGLRDIWAAARRAAQTVGLPLENIGLVVAHLGPGLTVASVCGGKIRELIRQQVADGDPQARPAADALVCQAAREIGRVLLGAGCEVEAIVLSGPLASSELVRTALQERVDRLAPLIALEGPLEMAALADAAIGVLSGRRPARPAVRSATETT